MVWLFQSNQIINEYVSIQISNENSQNYYQFLSRLCLTLQFLTFLTKNELNSFTGQNLIFLMSHKISAKITIRKIKIVV